MATVSGDMLAAIYAELQAVHADMASLPTTLDTSFLAALLLMLSGTVVGAVAALVIKEWFKR